jgi:5-formyltetrahydrofolate cyclo-ligase
LNFRVQGSRQRSGTPENLFPQKDRLRPVFLFFHLFFLLSFSLITAMTDLLPRPLATRNAIRQQLRRQRRQLSPSSRRQAGHAVVRHLQRQPEWRQAKQIGIYLDDFGEIPTRAIIHAAQVQHKTVYLPLIRAFDQRLVFVPIARQHWQQGRMARHRLGMLQPRHQRGIAVTRLDLLVMPLVAVDAQGMRLGMGGGFYDRTLAHAPHHPYRLGLAYDFQQVEQLQTADWDQPLHGLCTPSHYVRY